MTANNLEVYRPRSLVDLGDWEIDGLRLNVYGVIAVGQEVSHQLVERARTFVATEVPPLVLAEGVDNGLGFVIIHPGDLGVSILAHWWIQGSVLCQHIQRTLCNSDAPMDTATRPVIACVWELGLINAEQVIWREPMMSS